jgi:hypothetical protein
MTTSGKRWAAIIGIALALAFPTRDERTSGRCTDYSIKPWGVHLLEQLLGPISVAYSSGRDCR